MTLDRALSIVVVIPCYKVREQILSVISRIGPEVRHVIVVDDACPLGSGLLVRENCRDPRVQILTHAKNQGVGGAVMTGYRAALALHADIVVKIDGDGQMAPELLPRFVAPIAGGRADYAKGNRFYDLSRIGRMPTSRIIGNVALSFLTKLSCGYWNIFDPTNGYTAIDARTLARIPLNRVSSRYFFETDMLFRLNTLRAVVTDVPMDAVYGDEVSGLKISRIIGEFLGKHARNLAKRIFYNYFLRDMSIASFELLVGLPLVIFGVLFGAFNWFDYAMSGKPAPLGTIMLAALPVLVGLQFLLAFLSFDIASVPTHPVSESLPDFKDTDRSQQTVNPEIHQ